MSEPDRDEESGSPTWAWIGIGVGGLLLALPCLTLLVYVSFSVM